MARGLSHLALAIGLIGLHALAAPDLRAAECNSEIGVRILSGVPYGTAGDLYAVEIGFGTSRINGGLANTLDLGEVEFDLDCAFSGLPGCSDDGDILRFAGNLTTTCGVAWDVETPDSNTLRFKPSGKVLIPSNQPSFPGFCQLRFSIIVSDPKQARDDTTPNQVESFASAPHARCDNGLPAASLVWLGLDLCQSCDDEDPCTIDTCDHESGLCSHTTQSCDDGDVCTTDVCLDGGGCLHDAISCDDGDRCTLDACDPASGCHHSPTSCEPFCRITAGRNASQTSGAGDEEMRTLARAASLLFGGEISGISGSNSCSGAGGTAVSGSWRELRRGDRDAFASDAITSLVCGSDNACFSGMGRLSGVGRDTSGTDVAYRVRLRDFGERLDVYGMEIWIPGRGESAATLADRACCAAPAADLRAADRIEGGRVITGGVTIETTTGVTNAARH